MLFLQVQSLRHVTYEMINYDSCDILWTFCFVGYESISRCGTMHFTGWIATTFAGLQESSRWQLYTFEINRYLCEMLHLHNMEKGQIISHHGCRRHVWIGNYTIFMNRMSYMIFREFDLVNLLWTAKENFRELIPLFWKYILRNYDIFEKN